MFIFNFTRKYQIICQHTVPITLPPALCYHSSTSTPLLGIILFLIIFQSSGYKVVYLVLLIWFLSNYQHFLNLLDGQNLSFIKWHVQVFCSFLIGWHFFILVILHILTMSSMVVMCVASTFFPTATCVSLSFEQKFCILMWLISQLHGLWEYFPTLRSSYIL